MATATAPATRRGPTRGRCSGIRPSLRNAPREFGRWPEHAVSILGRHRRHRGPGPRGHGHDHEVRVRQQSGPAQGRAVQGGSPRAVLRAGCAVCLLPPSPRRAHGAARPGRRSRKDLPGRPSAPRHRRGVLPRLPSAGPSAEARVLASGDVGALRARPVPGARGPGVRDPGADHATEPVQPSHHLDADAHLAGARGRRRPARSHPGGGPPERGRLSTRSQRGGAWRGGAWRGGAWRGGAAGDGRPCRPGGRVDLPSGACDPDRCRDRGEIARRRPDPCRLHRPGAPLRRRRSGDRSRRGRAPDVRPAASHRGVAP